MARTYFYVQSHWNLGWVLYPESKVWSQHFASRAAALGAARAEAQRQHTISRMPISVRAQRSDGTWQDECTFGADLVSRGRNIPQVNWATR